ncbi:glutathione peroxidase [Carnobacterium iners]|uniref:Glutathione peroxidase n=1 Tax=Carnobacterium iners TaxID=1073423 RepID=A0A1X7MPX8_9LACT|nr:glutathione peroxidase [Carnobacterium iners]SEL29972.1 glutathione peroxidase [Carnobacterium iners]SMH26745.1 glutathione peroxidase [Carnobacterium iners]
MSVYDYSVTEIGGEEVSLSKYQGKPLLIVNTASKCGFAPQFEGLEELYKKYNDLGFTVLGFPSNQFMNQEPLSNEEIADHCQMTYNVSFPLHEKIKVNGNDASPLYKYLVEQTGNKIIKWNFTKFLVGKDGEIVKRFGSMTKPEKIEDSIIAILNVE